MRLGLDLFCKAGGASVGVSRAGFEMVGVDIEDQPRYPFAFYQADALTFPLDGFDFIWASPPCQRFSKMTKRWDPEAHPDLIAPIRARLKQTKAAWIIENVPEAPLLDPVMLCGSMFDLPLRRHRMFETSQPVPPPRPCHHQGRVVGVYGHPGGSSKRDGLEFGGVAEWRAAMGIDWMTADELAEAIPPAYALYLASSLTALSY